MNLSILVPHWKEDAGVIRPLLDSIAIQQNVDFDEVEVVICQDGFEAVDFWFTDDATMASDHGFGLIDRYPFRIRQIRLEQNNLSEARNLLLDSAEGDYVMFCDIDDMFYNVCGLWCIFGQMEKGFDLMVAKFVEEVHTTESNEITYIEHEYESTFIHGKVYRKAYLKENNIRWHGSLWVHEDYFFNVLAQSLTKDIRFCKTPYYLWVWRDNSACRSDPKHLLKTYTNLIDANDCVVDEFEKRGIEKEAQFYTALMVFDSYYTMNKYDWVYQANKEYRDATEKRFARYFAKHKTLWDNADSETKMEISKRVRERNVKEGMQMEGVTFDSWIKHIEEIDYEIE